MVLQLVHGGDPFRHHWNVPRSASGSSTSGWSPPIIGTSPSPSKVVRRGLSLYPSLQVAAAQGPPGRLNVEPILPALVLLLVSILNLSLGTMNQG